MGGLGQQAWGIWDSRHGAFEHGGLGAAGMENLGQQTWRIYTADMQDLNSRHAGFIQDMEDLYSRHGRFKQKI